jgi:PhzF family phenazine biosynthesis protein
MPILSYRIVNVFTRAGRLTGNPLCVVEDGTGVDDASMQALARQFNLSETTFILPSAKATARVRIFTPSYEMPFAGHPTLGTAHVVRALKGAGDAVALEMKAGIIPVNAKGDRWTLQAVEPKSRAVELTRAELEQILGLEAGDVAEWPLWVSAGQEQLVVPLASVGQRCAAPVPARTRSRA